MKFSESLLKEKDIGQRIFLNSLSKSKALLKDIFGLDFEKDDPKILKLEEDSNEYKFKVSFLLNNREIKALFEFKKENEGIVSEVLKIHELDAEEIILTRYDNFKNVTNEIMDILEKKYELNFTPLDPGERDENIKLFSCNQKEQILRIVFTTDDNEAEFEVLYKFPDNKNLIISECKQHLIYIE